MGLLWLWVLLAGLLGGLGLAAWGLWWLWRRAVGVGTALEHLMGRLDEAGQILERIDPSPLEESAQQGVGKH